MSPDVWLTILFSILAAAAYVLWVLELMPRLRMLCSLAAIVSFGAALLLHQLVANSQSNAAQDSPDAVVGVLP